MIEPFKGWRFGRLMIGMCEFLNGDVLKLLPNDLLSQIIVQYIVVDRHAKIAGVGELRFHGSVFHLKNFIHCMSEHFQRRARYAKGMFAFQNPSIHLADLAERVCQRPFKMWRVHNPVCAL